MRWRTSETVYLATRSKVDHGLHELSPAAQSSDGLSVDWRCSQEMAGGVTGRCRRSESLLRHSAAASHLKSSSYRFSPFLLVCQ